MDGVLVLRSSDSAMDIVVVLGSDVCKSQGVWRACVAEEER